MLTGEDGAMMAPGNVFGDDFREDVGSKIRSPGFSQSSSESSEGDCLESLRERRKGGMIY
jgi:hypothetical protein